MKNPSSPAAPWSRALFVLYGVSALAGMAVGLYNPLIAVMMKDGGQSETAIGAASSLFFLCVILTAPFAGYLARTLSMRATLAAGLVISGGVSCLFPFAHDFAAWAILRGMLGVGIGLYLIGGQSAVNTFATDANRTVVSGLHALAFGIGMGVGPVLGAGLFAIDPKLAFFVCAGILWIGVPAVRFWLPVEVARKTGSLRPEQIKMISLSLHAVFAYGVAEATLMSLFPVFMIDRGYSMATMSFAFSCFVLGGIFSTLPITRLADRFGQERVLAYCALVGVAGSIAMTWTSSPTLALIASAITGASLGPVFALALAIVGRLLPREDIPGGSAFFTAAFSFGSMVAPWLAAVIMKEFGSAHIFTLSAVFFGSLFLRLVTARTPAREAVGT